MTGEQLSALQSIYAKCYECCGGYDSGKEDCGIPDCPIYPFMPFQKSVVRKKKQVKPMTESHKAKLRVARVRNG